MLKLRFQQNSYLYLVPGYSTFLNAAEGLDTRVVCETADGRLEAVGDYALLRGRAPRLEKVFQKSEEQLASDEVLKRNGQKQKGQDELTLDILTVVRANDESTLLNGERYARLFKFMFNNKQ